MIYCKGSDFVTYDILMYWTDVKNLLPMRNYPGWEWFHWTFIDIGTKPHFNQWSGDKWKWPIRELVDDTKTDRNCKKRCSHSQPLRSQTKCINIPAHVYNYFPNILHLRKRWPWHRSLGCKGYALPELCNRNRWILAMRTSKGTVDWE